MSEILQIEQGVFIMSSSTSIILEKVDYGKRLKASALVFDLPFLCIIIKS